MSPNLARARTATWSPAGWAEDSPWLRMFRNARVWLDELDANVPD